MLGTTTKISTSAHWLLKLRWVKESWNIVDAKSRVFRTSQTSMNWWSNIRSLSGSGLWITNRIDRHCVSRLRYEFPSRFNCQSCNTNIYVDTIPDTEAWWCSHTCETTFPLCTIMHLIPIMRVLLKTRLAIDQSVIITGCIQVWWQVSPTIWDTGFR